MTHTYEDYKRFVKDAAVELDELVPNWHNLINLWELKFTNYRRCIIGQLDGWDSFYDSIKNRVAFENTFHSNNNAIMEQFWISEIQERREPDVSFIMPNLKI